MRRRPHRNDTPAFKAKVALAASKGDRTLADLAQQSDVQPIQITQWKAQLQEGPAGKFGIDARGDALAAPIEPNSLHEKIEELALENDFYLARSARPACRAQSDDRPGA